MTRSELLDKAMNTTWKKIEGLEPGSKERKFMEETFCKLVELDIRGTEVEYNEYAQEQRIDADKEAKAAEIKLKMEQFKEDRKWRFVPSADAVLITTIFALMTLILYVIEGKGVIAPKSAKVLEKMLRFVRIG